MAGLKYVRPTAIATCLVCGIKFTSVKSKILSGERKCCSVQCRGRIARSKQENTGRKPSHGGCVGGKLSSLYRRWAGIKGRCYHTKNSAYKNYGARGITMCQEWRESFETFSKWAIENGFRDELQIDRKENDRGYYPDNCRWVTPRRNANNRRNSVSLPGGLRVSEVAESIGVSRQAIRYRLSNLKLPVDVAISIPKTPNGVKRKYFKKLNAHLWLMGSA